VLRRLEQIETLGFEYAQDGWAILHLFCTCLLADGICKVMEPASATFLRATASGQVN
jgi:hypothetical protein